MKYERIYHKAYDAVSADRADIADYFDLYNSQRPHLLLDKITPDHTYLDKLPMQP